MFAAVVGGRLLGSAKGSVAAALELDGSQDEQRKSQRQHRGKDDDILVNALAPRPTLQLAFLSSQQDRRGLVAVIARLFCKVAWDRS